METVNKIFSKIEYNGHDVSEDFAPYIKEIIYRDFEENESEELTITLKDYDKYFQNSWYLNRGAKISCKIGDDFSTLDCGIFTIDEVDFDFRENGDYITIRALATSIIPPLRTKNTRYFENKTLQDIAQFFGDKYGFEVIKDLKPVYIERLNQVMETDLGFLKRIARDYGYIFKIIEGKLVFVPLDREEASLFTLEKGEVSSLKIKDETKYRGCSVKYFNPMSKKLCSSSTECDDGYDTLKIIKKCSSKEDAQILSNSKLQENRRDFIGRIKLKEGNPLFLAGVNFDLKGFSMFDGTYRIKSVTHCVCAGKWSVFGEIERRES